MVDTGDLKSPACKSVRVRVSFMAEIIGSSNQLLPIFHMEARLETRRNATGDGVSTKA